MARENRMIAYGKIYQIINRGRKDMFKEPHDKIKFLASLGAAKEKYDFLLLGYSIMDDRYHLLIKTHNISISKVMQSINTSYGKYYNNKYKKSPFKGRFKSKIIKDHLLMESIKYIHNLGEEYNPYTSHSFYQMNVDSIVDIDYLLNLLESDRVSAIEGYSKYMDLDEDHKDLEIRPSNAEALDMLLREVSSNPTDYKLIKEGSKKSYLMAHKRKFIKRAVEAGYKSKEIGGAINISDRAVRKHISILKKEE